jgi:CrcB protein
MGKLLAIGLGGFVGALARYGVSGWVQRRTSSAFPAGTLAVNVVGCLVLGALMTLVETRPMISPQVRTFVAVGILGSFTTFSTVGFETLELVRVGTPRMALASVAANLAIGLAAVWIGRTLVRLVFE